MSNSTVMLMTFLATGVLSACSSQDLECRTDLDCEPGHLCTRDNVCTEHEITNFIECAEVRPIVTEGDSHPRGRYTVFLVVPGKRTDEIFERNLRRMAWDCAEETGLDVFVRVVVPDSTAEAGARFVQPAGVEGLVLTETNSDLPEALVQTIAGLPEENSRATIKAGLWALEQMASGEIQDNSMGVVVYILDDLDDCSTVDATGTCDPESGLLAVDQLTGSYMDVIESIQEDSVWTLLNPVFRPLAFVNIVSSGNEGCTTGEFSYPTASRYSPFVEWEPVVESGVDVEDAEFCNERWVTAFAQFSSESYGDSHPNESLTRFSFSYMPVSEDLVFVFLNSVLIDKEDIVFDHLTYRDETLQVVKNAHPTAADIWNGFNQELWQNLQIVDIKESEHWGDSLQVLYCPVYHTENPMQDSLKRMWE